jgi:hypothetical protein
MGPLFLGTLTCHLYSGTLSHMKAMRKPGRSAAGHARRREQLRLAKRAQRERDREAGLVLCQIKLHPTVAEKLRAGVSIPGFEAGLATFLDEALVDVTEYPNLRLLCWNRNERFIPAHEAFALYERNWRFVDEKALDESERELIARLARTYGGGLLNV